MIKKVAIIGTVGLPSNYGGFETLVEYITRDLNNDFEFTVYCSSKSYTKKVKSYNNCRLHYIKLDANGLQSIPYDIFSMIHAARYADVLLVLGHSGAIFYPFLKLFYKKSIIVNIDGCEWKRNKFNFLTKKFLKFSEKLSINFASQIIGDNKVIVDYVLKSHNKRANLIAYGGDHVKKNISSTLKKKYTFFDKPYSFKVCRIEPENNIEMILEAFSCLKNKNLVIVGNWKNSKFGLELKSKYESFDNIYLLNAIYDQNILDQIRSNCHIYIHGHSAGGTNPSLVEAMSLGLPIFCFNIGYNKATTHNSAKYFNSSSELMDILNNTKPEELVNIRSKMIEIAKKEYKWSHISEKYKKLIIKS